MLITHFFTGKEVKYHENVIHVSSSSCEKQNYIESNEFFLPNNHEIALKI